MPPGESGPKESRDGPLVLRFDGVLGRERVAELWRDALATIDQVGPARVVVDLGEVTAVDSAGVALLQALEARCRGLQFEISAEGSGERVRQFLGYAREHSSGLRREPPGMPPGLVERAGRWAETRLERARSLIRFLGAFVAGTGWLLAHPHRWRVRETLSQIQRVGADAMPLVAGLSFLMGIIMGFQALTSLENIGAYIYIADVVTVSTTREMAPLLTAVILAGRSGAAFAAELGTMKINEEIDALAVMGFDIPRFLVAPRVFAMVVAAPLLTMLANAMGILGGGAMGRFILNVSALDYFSEVNKVLSGPQIYSGLIKGFGFGWLVGFIGCFHGLQAGTAAEDVGVQTTSAVVSGILLIVVADALFSAIFQTYGW